MDREELRELEKRCIQEEPPYCTARCPIHVDARAFLKHAGAGAWQEARKVLDRTMPLSSILGRLCDHPCEAVCKRGEAGDPIAVGTLERFCLQRAPAQGSVRRLPSRGLRIAVRGDGLDSLTATWDLLRKGYEVAMFCSDASGRLLKNYSEETLPLEVIEEELAVLRDWGLQFFPAGDFAVGCGEAPFNGFDAAYEGSGDGILRDPIYEVNPATLETNCRGLFASIMDKRGRSSPIGEAAMGRKAAVSIDRYLQKTSMSAGREKEGPCTTRLFTRLEGVPILHRVVTEDPISGYGEQEAIREAKRCLQCQCLECVKACEYLERFRGYPKTYAREIYNNETALIRNREANRLVNACTLCGLCAEICPHDFSMAELCLQARRRMVRKGKMPPSAHEFAILDMQFSNSERFALSRNEPGTSGSTHLFFPGCQLSGSSPGHVELTYSYLREKLSGGVGLMLGCCGAPAEWAGEEERFGSTLLRFREQWSDLGRPRIIAGCTTCHKIFREHIPESEIVSLWEQLETIGLPQVGRREYGSGKVAVHDPCTARHENKIQESVRRLLSGLGLDVRELPLSRRLTGCCGYGGLLSNADPPLADDIARRRAGQDPVDYVAYCAMCRDSLAAQGKRIFHLLDLIWGPFPAGDSASRKPPGYSERQENRARLKRRLPLDLWKERPVEMEPYEKIILRISPEVRERMEKRRILVEDVQRAIDLAETTGRKLHDPQTGHYLAHHTPARVTYWVEYSSSEGAFIIHNAYCHRMQVVEEDS